jgi:hypothetical protein
MATNLRICHLSLVFVASVIMFPSCVFLVDAWGFGSAPSSTRSTTARTTKTDENCCSAEYEISRRDAFLRTIQSSATVLMTNAAATSVFPGTSWADVSDGNALPDGAAQFGRIIRGKADLQMIKKRVLKSSSEMDKKEWDNVGGFLRRVYGLSDDMKSISSTMDETKKKQAVEFSDSIKKLSKAADAPASSQNGPEFVAYVDKIDSILGDFLALLQDVPDEL